MLKQEKLESVNLDTVQIGTELAPTSAGPAPRRRRCTSRRSDEGLASGYKIVYSFATQYPGGYAFSTMDTLKSTIAKNPQMVQAFVNGMGQAEAMIQQSPATATSVAEKEFPTLSKTIVDSAVNRLIADHIYAVTPDISHASFKNALALQVYVGNVKPRFRRLFGCGRQLLLPKKPPAGKPTSSKGAPFRRSSCRGV